MNLAAEFQKIITPGFAGGGTVVAIDGDYLRVQSPAGIVLASRGIHTDIALGDSVDVVNNAIVGRRRRESQVPVFYL